MRVSVDGLSKRYQVRTNGTKAYPTFRDVVADVFKPAAEKYRDFWAVRDLAFDVGAGECVALLGRNGSGKSTTLKMLSRIVQPTAGRIRMRGRVSALLEVGTGFHPELTGRENVFVNGAIHGMSRREVAGKLDEIVAFSECEAFLDTPVKRYSSGMYTRLAFAVGAHLDPDVLIVDEVLAVGDAAFQKKCLGRMGEAAREGRTILFVSHSIPAVQALCSRVLILSNGRLEFDGPVSEGLAVYAARGGAQGPGPEEIAASIAALPANELARIGALRLWQGGRPARVVRNDLPLEVEMEVEVGRPVLGLRAAFDCWEPMGGLLFRSFHDEMDKGQPEAVAAGRHVLRFTLPTSALGPTSYVFGVSLWIYGRGPVLDQKVELEFPIEDRSGVNALRPATAFQGRIYSGGQWSDVGSPGEATGEAADDAGPAGGGRDLVEAE